MVDGLVFKTFNSLGVPVQRIFFDGKADTFIVFMLLGDDEPNHADDEAVSLEHQYRASIFSKDNYTELLASARKALKAAGFYGFTVNAEMYESDTKYYHVSFDFNYLEVDYEDWT